MSKKLVIIVEDNQSESYVIARQLRQSEFMAFECSSLAAARDAFKTRPEIFLVDAHMPDGSGVDFCKELRNHEFSKNAVIILMSVHLDGNFDHADILACGADAFLMKPFTKEKLLQTLAELSPR